jgi:hypothetical protein
MKKLIYFLVLALGTLGAACKKESRCANVNCSLPGVIVRFQLLDNNNLPLAFGTGNILPADSIAYIRSFSSVTEYCRRDTVNGQVYFSFNALVPASMPLQLKVFRNRTEAVSMTFETFPVGCCYDFNLKSLSLNNTPLLPANGLINSSIYYAFRF